MNMLAAIIAALVALVLVLMAVTRIGVIMIERRHPPAGIFVTANGTDMHLVRIPAGDDADLPPVVFLHGASGNLHDAMTIYGDRLRGRADLLFVDRPGHGWSSRGPAENALPDGQARTLAAMLDELGIEKAIVVGHSFGGAIAVSFALNHPDRTAGTVFLSPVSHPWPGGISWYYTLTATPIVGWLFSETLAMPGGWSRMEDGTACVFAPNRPTPDYAERTRLPLLFRPNHFRANAVDVANLYDHVAEVSPRYREIETPSVIITGNKDTIVLPSIHSTGLARDLQNAELVRIHNLGHKPDHVLPDLVVAALESVAGRERDLQALARTNEAQLASDAFGPIERCLDNEEIRKEVRAAGYRVE
ncbi:MAG: alpha/beta hydrolase [Oricola sp.]|nr:MAG: alpha/beta hydrolase [Oricola sp.]